MGKALFITATDTGAGKTLVTGLIGRYLRGKGLSVVTQKWVETGSADGMSHDLREHGRIMGISAPVSAARAPYVFHKPCSPHLAARREGARVRPGIIEKSFASLCARYDVVLVEGAGGILVPLSHRLLLVDLLRRVSAPVVVVVNNRLGAINHALLTVESLRARGLAVVGLVFNAVARGDAEIQRDNMRIVARFSGARVLGSLPHVSQPGKAYKHFLPIGEKVWRFLRA